MHSSSSCCCYQLLLLSQRHYTNTATAGLLFVHSGSGRMHTAVTGEQRHSRCGWFGLWILGCGLWAVVCYYFSTQWCLFEIIIVYSSQKWPCQSKMTKFVMCCQHVGNILPKCCQLVANMLPTFPAKPDTDTVKAILQHLL
jgi:hypothetical protein